MSLNMGRDRTPFCENVLWSQVVLSSECPLKTGFNDLLMWICSIQYKFCKSHINSLKGLNIQYIICIRFNELNRYVIIINKQSINNKWTINQSINIYLVICFDIFQTWYGKTPLGKKRAKAAAGEDEEPSGKGGKKGKGKKGGKKGKKKK